MADDQAPSRYPYLISVRGGRPVPARKDGSYYVCAYQTQLGLWWPRRQVQVLEYDPHRDFYQEQRQASLNAHPQAPTDPDAPALGQPEATPASTSCEQAPAEWERVESRPVPRPALCGDAGSPAARQPGVGW